MKNRRDFLKTMSLSSAALGTGSLISCAGEKAVPESVFQISLAQWSNHKALKGGEMDNLDWPAHTKETFGIDAVEWVNQFFGEQNDKLGLQPKGGGYLEEMKKRTDDLGVTNVLIMCDRVGNLGNPDEAARTASIEGHYAWLDAASFLGCHSIRVNARSDDKLPADEQAELCADGLSRLSTKAAEQDLNVIVENHGGLSSDGAWLADVMKRAGLDNCGTLPDFGNFYVARNRGKQEQYDKQKALYEGREYQEDEKGLYYDRYEGIRDLMPWAKGVSAKSHDFDGAGSETNTDFLKAMSIVKESGYTGYVGVEYEGSELSEDEGIQATKDLLVRVFAELA